MVKSLWFSSLKIENLEVFTFSKRIFSLTIDTRVPATGIIQWLNCHKVVFLGWEGINRQVISFSFYILFNLFIGR